MLKKALNLRSGLIALSVLILIGVLVWQGVYFKGNPDPTAHHITPAAAVINTAILVFREGLEAILVLAAIISGLIRKKQDNYWKPISIGAGVSFIATLATWFAVVAIIASVNASQLNIQAFTGVLAVVVLLIILNWFFHKVYWTGWIGLHNRKKQQLITSDTGVSTGAFWSLFLVGLTSVYREGFEVVLFLQNLRLKVGDDIILQGTLIGLALTLMVGVLTFLFQKKLPHKKMLVFTGALLVMVLAVMVGETVQEMQQAGWMATTPIGVEFPDWIGVWFCVFSNVQGLSLQAVAVVYVLGSYFLQRYLTKRKALKRLEAANTLEAKTM
ncbi:FTR1 family iron permease [Heyndrickxia acidicola]|uniref:FTR1 family protein n=1 Tax=Heyndrickxia acidicola TaxID=209389 RepID=A0ABU6MQ28_9BACI|nr:FTR1 family protein [Heyndrickxia acidicola]MED1205337.1 FTR1 family protein [Heyndrickxia acidicola]